MSKLDQAMRYLNEWIEENQQGITTAVLAAFSKINDVSEAMTDIDVHGATYVQQKIDGLITAAHAVLPEFIREAFENEFSTVREPIIASALKKATELIARERRSEFIRMLIERMLIERHGH